MCGYSLLGKEWKSTLKMIAPVWKKKYHNIEKSSSNIIYSMILYFQVVNQIKLHFFRVKVLCEILVGIVFT